MDEWTTDRAGERRGVDARVTQDGAFGRAVARRAAAAPPHAMPGRHGAVGSRARDERAAEAGAAIEDRLLELLDEVHEELANQRVAAPFARLVDGLARMLDGIEQETVRQRLRPLCARHPIRELLRQDPFTRHSEDRPRGYAGDADLIDFIYGVRGPGAGASGLGSEVFAQLIARRGPASVRHRRALIADTIDAQAEAAERPIGVLSLACGHVREAFLSGAVARGRARIAAFDQDERSVATARQAYEGWPVDVAVGSVRQAIAGRLTDERFDLVYSAGLYDYLADSTATRLTTRLFDLVRPGGRLLIANFLPTCAERGYMEAFMDWFLQYRTQEAFARLSSEIPDEHIERERTFTDPEGQIVYLELVRR